MNALFGKLSIFLGGVIMCFLMGCKEEIVQEVVVGNNSSDVMTVNDVKIKVYPIYLECGDEVTIEVKHLKNLAVPVIVSSKSLEFEDSLITPSIIRKKILSKGEHDLVFECGTDSFSVVTSTLIRAY